jgi:cell division protein ZapA
MRELAAYVDGQMKEIERGTGTVDPHRVAILAALTIADELHRLRRQYGELEMAADNAAKRLLSLSETIDDHEP